MSVNRVFSGVAVHGVGIVQSTVGTKKHEPGCRGNHGPGWLEND
jgi:hypothetical protein